MVPLVTPARRATSSSFVAAKPRSAKTSSAALMISSGRASFRRRQRGLAVACDMCAPMLLTERSVSNKSDRQTSTPPAVIQDEVGTRRRGAELAQERHDLAAVVGRMVDEMAKHLPVCMNVFPTAGRLYESRLLQPVLREPAQKAAPLRLDRFPAPADVRQRFQIGPLWNGGIGLPHPAMQPQLLGPDDVGERSVNPAVAALQIPEVLLLRQPRDRVEDCAVRPGVVVEQLEELVHGARWRRRFLPHPSRNLSLACRRSPACHP